MYGAYDNLHSCTGKVVQRIFLQKRLVVPKSPTFIVRKMLSALRTRILCWLMTLVHAMPALGYPPGNPLQFIGAGLRTDLAV